MNNKFREAVHIDLIDMSVCFDDGRNSGFFALIDAPVKFTDVTDSGDCQLIKLEARIDGPGMLTVRITELFVGDSDQEEKPEIVEHTYSGNFIVNWKREIVTPEIEQ